MRSATSALAQIEVMQTDLIIHIVERVRVSVPEPVFQGNPCLSEVILLEHVFVPYDELQDAELVRERKVYREVERGILRSVCGVERALCDMGMVAMSEERDDDESALRGDRTEKHISTPLVICDMRGRPEGG